MRIHTNRKDIIWNYLGTFCTLIINILILPLLIKYLDANEVGLWYVFVSIGGITALFDFGFAATLARNITYCLSGASSLKSVGKSSQLSDVNLELLSEVTGTCKLVYFIIAFIALILMCGVGTPYILYITKNIFLNNYMYAWIIYTLAIILNLLFFYYTSLLRGAGDIASYNKCVVISRTAQIIVAVVLLINGYGIIAMSISYLVYSLVFRLLTSYIIRINHPIFKKTKINIKQCYETFKIVWHNAWRDGLVSLSNYLTTYGMTIVCSAYLSLSESGIYSISFQITNGVSMLAIIYFNSLQPAMQSNYINNRLEDLRKQYSKATVLYFISYLIVALGVLIIGIPVLKLIRPDYVINQLFLSIMLINVLFIQFHCMNASFISNTNRLPYVKAFIISSIASLITVAFVLKEFDFGIWCIPLIQFIIHSLFNNWKWPKYVMDMLQTNIKETFLSGFYEIKKIVRVLYEK